VVVRAALAALRGVRHRGEAEWAVLLGARGRPRASVLGEFVTSQVTNSPFA
jgi:hypothetical protein